MILKKKFWGQLEEMTYFSLPNCWVAFFLIFLYLFPGGYLNEDRFHIYILEPGLCDLKILDL